MWGETTAECGIKLGSLRRAGTMVLQLPIAGVALGSIYGLLSLALVLIHKATEVVNFAQGEMALGPSSPISC